VEIEHYLVHCIMLLGQSWLCHCHMVEIQIRITGFFIYACTHYNDMTCFKLTLANFDYLSLSFSSLFMVALCNRADHIYFHAVVCSFFFPRLISAAADWMSALLPHMVWP